MRYPLDLTFDYSGKKENISIGHIEFIGDYEFYQCDGDIYIAHYTNVLEISTRQRIGRFFCTAITSKACMDLYRNAFTVKA